jgi:hypothetical protein
MVLKRLCVSVPSTFGIKLLLKSRCDCGRSCDTESIVLMLKFDTACMQNSQVCLPINTGYTQRMKYF